MGWLNIGLFQGWGQGAASYRSLTGLLQSPHFLCSYVPILVPTFTLYSNGVTLDQFLGILSPPPKPTYNECCGMHLANYIFSTIFNISTIIPSLRQISPLTLKYLRSPRSYFRKQLQYSNSK